MIPRAARIHRVNGYAVPYATWRRALGAHGSNVVPLHKSDPVTSRFLNQLDEIAERVGRDMARAFLLAVEQLRGQINMAELVRMIDEHGMADLEQLLHPRTTDEMYAPLAETAAASVSVAGAGISALHQAPALGGLEVLFNVMNPATVSWIQQYQMTLIREMSNQTRQVINQTITDGLIAGKGPRDVARTVRQNIGLTLRQQQAVQNYENALRSGSADALDRKLRDKRFDRTVQRAIDTGVPLTPAQIRRMTDRYRERYLKYRSETIARTEGLRATHAGDHLYWQQAVEAGKVDERLVRRFWKYSRDERTRAEHRMIPSMNPKGVDLNEKFRTPLGPLMYPGDPNGVAGNTINCFVPNTQIRGDVVAGSKARYAGPVIEIKTASGRTLTVTPNHPILTMGWGMVAANCLDKSDYLVAYQPQVKNAVGIGHEHSDYVPPLADQIYRTISDFSDPFEARVVSMDFHGDGPNIKGNVEVILPDWQLLSDLISAHSQEYADFRLVETDDPSSSFGAFDQFGFTAFSSTRSIVSSDNLARPLVAAHERPLYAFRFGLIPQGGACISELSTYRGTTDPGFLRDLVDRFPSQVFPDQIVNVRQFDFTGHVYDFETTTGLIVAQDIVTSNCRCSVFTRILSPELVGVAEEPTSEKPKRRKPPKRRVPKAPTRRRPAKPKQPPPAVAAPHVPITEISPVSAEFRDELRGGLATIPEWIQTRINALGGQIHTGDMFTDINPDLKGKRPRGWPEGSTYDNLSGSYDTDLSRIDLSEHRIDANTGGKVSAQHVRQTIRHETGHMFDHLVGQDVYGRDLSHLDEFLEAHARDIAKLDEDQRFWFNYFIMPDRPFGGAEETLAELFAYLHGGSKHKTIGDVFPESRKALQTILDRLSK